MKIEMTLMRLLARTEIDKKSVEMLLINNINWGGFLEEIFNNKVVGLVFLNLHKNQLLNYVPRYIYRLLTAYWKSTIIKTNAYFNYIEKIACKLNDANIQYAFIKGFDLIDKLYYEKAQYGRTFNDLDVLVSQHDLPNVEKIFLDEGFVFGDFDLIADEIVLADRTDVIKMKMISHQIYPLIKKVNYDKEGIFKGPINLDINFTIFDGGKNAPLITTEKLLESVEVRKAFNGIEYKALDIYYTFVQLVYHLFREAHTTEFVEKKIDISLRKFCDIYEYLIWAKSRWDVTKLTEIVYSANLSESFWFVLYFTDMLYETNFLESILESGTNYEEKYKDYIGYFKCRFRLS